MSEPVSASRFRPSPTALVMALVVLAAALLLALGMPGEKPAPSPLPSAKNPGPRGFAALFAYLAESDVPVATWDESFTTLSDADALLVIPTPLRAPPSDAELDALVRWVEGGGTALVLLSADDRFAMPLRQRLGVAYGSEQRGFGDAREELVRALETMQTGQRPPGLRLWPLVPWAFAPPAELEVPYSAEARVEGGACLVGDAARAFASVAARGKGRVLAVARPDPLENHSIARADNLAFAGALFSLAARPGRLLFEERHLHATAAEPLPPGIAATLLQLAVAFGVLALARGVRLGSARPTPIPAGRSSREYVERLGELYRKAGVERALLAELPRSFRRLLHERAGTSLSLDERGVDELLAARGIRAPGEYLRLVVATRAAAERPSERGFTELARAWARLESDLSTGGGRSPR